MKIHIERDCCISSGSCVLEAPAVFDQDDDGVVVLLEERPGDTQDVRDAVANCPSGALSITDE